ncbi:quinone reductase, putative [Trichomonas vaginalis G3]|uniref:Quinone reductase, putative n=1 Tax=Trichomonas vaginalis (strain ATCC PRA-98 / G3) TaxID=412133 RepID=A2DTY1_TRIV3|nr:NAD(P)H oxidoreductase-related family [Trichomonas vaginalis G3]EAY16128.1 quinone reductase, putative [Trichomonas vaginalis G3]KAI5510455.1 NAD(P)H oxidoreductase-related family [Trichomonas vaginalis G3]|eukprot:XP_001328351.1 quinone reductase [Trichomonas vaginalis G3]
MKVLILIAHADTTHQATAFRIAKAAKEALLAQNHEVREVVLIEEGFDRVLTESDFKVKKTSYFDYFENSKDGNLVDTITKQVDNINWCTHILVIGPMWYFRFPACFEAWIERVLINVDGQSKKVSFVISNAGDEQYYSEKGSGSIEQLLFSEYTAFTYGKFQVNRPLGYYNAEIGPKIDHEKEKAWIEKFKVAVCQLDHWQLWGTNDNKPPLSPETIVMSDKKTDL